MTEIVPVMLEMPKDPYNVEVDDKNEIVNYGELEMVGEVRGMEREEIAMLGWERQIVEEGDASWQDKFADIEQGETYVVG